MNTKIVLFLLFCLMPYSVHAEDCNHYYNEWQSHLAAYERSQVIGGAAAVAGTLLTLPMLGIGGLWAGGMGALMAKNHNDLAQMNQRNYKACIERKTKEEADKIAAQFAEEEKKRNHGRPEAIAHALKIIEDSRNREIHSVVSYGQYKLDEFVKGLVAEGIDLNDPAVIEYIASEKASVEKQVQEYIKDQVEPEFENVRNNYFDVNDEIIPPPDYFCECCKKTKFKFKRFAELTYVGNCYKKPLDIIMSR